MKNKNKLYKSKPIEKKHPSPKRPINPVCPPKENLDGTNRFGHSVSRKVV
tara:strand:- start:506 stop:655 length:150 start_codon:yes stop_codon:yes gene_type:complete